MHTMINILVVGGTVKRVVKVCWSTHVDLVIRVSSRMIKLTVMV